MFAELAMRVGGRAERRKGGKAEGEQPGAADGRDGAKKVAIGR
jgi:hypothetical protein